MEKFVPEPLIWELLMSTQRMSGNVGSDFVDMAIYRHRKNYNNNGDKFLFVIDSHHNEFAVRGTNVTKSEALNTCDYDLPKTLDTGQLAFVVVGNCEYSSLIDCMENARKHTPEPTSPVVENRD